jgi:hypothetical protein
LKNTKTRFIRTTRKEISIIELGREKIGTNLIKMLKKIAIKIFERGPAAATINYPHL